MTAAANTRSASRAIRPLLVVAISAAALAVAGCAHASHARGGGQPDGGVGGVGALPSQEPVTLQSGTASPSPAGVKSSPSASRSTSASPSASASASASASVGAQIVYFKVTHQPSCPVVGTPDAPFSAPGQDVTIAWKTTGTTGVALSVDDPTYFSKNKTGSYANYGAEGSQTLSFPCDTSMATTTHKYTINTIGGGPSKAMTLTVSAPSKP